MGTDPMRGGIEEAGGDVWRVGGRVRSDKDRRRRARLRDAHGRAPSELGDVWGRHREFYLGRPLPVHGKEHDMTFAGRMRVAIGKGAAAVGGLAKRAGEKARDLGAMGVLRVEIGQLRVHEDRLIAKLGSEVYMTLVGKNHATVSRDTPSIREVLRDIEGLRTRSELKRRDYRSVSGREAADLRAVEGS